MVWSLPLLIQVDWSIQLQITFDLVLSYSIPILMHSLLTLRQKEGSSCLMLNAKVKILLCPKFRSDQWEAKTRNIVLGSQVYQITVVSLFIVLPIAYLVIDFILKVQKCLVFNCSYEITNLIKLLFFNLLVHQGVVDFFCQPSFRLFNF